ncbi:MAG: hypothetical protein KME32_07765 [Mojavia pulchra JT2-VF2]|jgi:restriction system protein|uniref:Restriction endonuclease n=1 Tax=Mojavia pulchra JT2-VF2 TaxID=287848 RepID=A0A951UFE3_9NOST|nr:hypothetical protein [Mojavia pulchra JT2-VF2]
MSHRSSPSSLLKTAVRESARTQRQAEIERKRSIRKQERALKDKQKQSKQNYLEQRSADVDDINEEIADWVNELQMILEHTLRREDTISFEDLRIRETFPPMQVPKKLSVATVVPQFYQPKSPPDWAMRLLPFIKQQYINAQKKAELNYQLARQEYEELESIRQANLQQLRADYERDKHSFILEMQKQNAEIDELEAAYQDGEASAVAIYNEMVLERSEYPSLSEFKYLCYTSQDRVAFTQQFQVVYIPELKQLVIDYELPTSKIIPTIAEVKYDHSKDEIQGVTRKTTEIEAIYQDIVAAITLRTIREVFEADHARHLKEVVFNGLIKLANIAKGQYLQPYLISVQVSNDRFRSLDFNKIDKQACLHNWGAIISSNLLEIQPIKPMVDINLVNTSFIEPEEISSEINSITQISLI